MNISTLHHQTLVHNNQPLQYSLPLESMEATGHASASSVDSLTFLALFSFVVTLGLLSHSLLWTLVLFLRVFGQVDQEYIIRETTSSVSSAPIIPLTLYRKTRFNDDHPLNNVL
jgi:hypothetical protein